MAKLADCPLPRTRAYVSSLPKGLQSYPDTQVKGSAIAAVLKNLPDDMDMSRFPDELREMLDRPPPVSAWVPEIPFVALMLAVCELIFENDEAFLAWAEDGFKGYFSASLYRILFAVLSPARLAKGADKKWGALRRGSRREMIEATDDFNRGRVIYPRNAFPLLYVKILCKGFLVAYRLSRAANADVCIESWSPTEAVLQIVYDVDNFVPPPRSSHLAPEPGAPVGDEE